MRRFLFKAHHILTLTIFTQESQAVGLIILERCQVEADCESGNRNAFKLGKSALMIYTFML